MATMIRTDRLDSNSRVNFQICSNPLIVLRFISSIYWILNVVYIQYLCTPENTSGICFDIIKVRD